MEAGSLQAFKTSLERWKPDICTFSTPVGRQNDGSRIYMHVHVVHGPRLQINNRIMVPVGNHWLMRPGSLLLSLFFKNSCWWIGGHLDRLYIMWIYFLPPPSLPPLSHVAQFFFRLSHFLTFLSFPSINCELFFLLLSFSCLSFLFMCFVLSVMVFLPICMDNSLLFLVLIVNCFPHPVRVDNDKDNNNGNLLLQTWTAQ